MYALNSIKDDLEIQIETQPDHEIHRFFYKGLQLGKVYWRPTAIYRKGRCDWCVDGLCWVCEEYRRSPYGQRLGSSVLGLKIDNYCNNLFQMEDPLFDCVNDGCYLLVYLHKIQILRVSQAWYKWSGKACTYHNCSTRIEIFDDRLEIQESSNRNSRRSADPVVFYKAIPLHREILANLRKFVPFTGAPVWL